MSYQLDQLLEAFLPVRNTDGLIAFWQEVPADLEDTFLDVRASLAQAADDTDLAIGLRERLEALEAVLDEASEPGDEESAGATS